MLVFFFHTFLHQTFNEAARGMSERDKPTKKYLSGVEERSPRTMGCLDSMTNAVVGLLQYARGSYFKEQILLRKAFGRVFPKDVN